MLRAALVGWSVAALAVIAHLVADGMAPPALAVILVGLASTGTALVLSTRQLTPWILVALIGSAQVAVHLLGNYLTGPAHHMTPAVDSQLMFAAHALSTAATALLLAHGERVWWLLAAWLDGWRTTFQVHGHPEARLPRLITQQLRSAGAADLQYSVGRRGPPAFTQH